MELVLEQTQQGTSYEVSVRTEGVEELKLKVKIKGEKKEALFTLRQKPGGLRSDEHFNAQEWLSISREENLSLSRSHASTIWNPVLRVLHKMITYGLCQRTTVEVDEEEKNWWSEIEDLDTTTLRELIDSEGRLIPEAQEPGVSRIKIPRPPRASMHDLYERMGSMEIRQGAIKRMSYSQS
nr:hypothetical protein [Tanacetum cinerariifolium]